MTAVTDATPLLAEAVVRQYARQLVAKSGRSSAAPLLLLRAQPSWSGPAEIVISGPSDGVEARVHVKACVSSLAVREAMIQRATDDYLIVLTDRSDADLGLGILSHCFDQRVVTPSLWEAVKGAFQAKQVDGLLARLSWIAEPLLVYTPPGGWPAAPSGVLTRDHALRHLTASLLRLPSGELDPSLILSWTLDGDPTDLRQLPKDVRDGIIAWVSETMGPVAGLALTSACQGHSVDAISLGLAADVLWTDSIADADMIAARTRLERWTGIRNLSPATARALADAARGASQRMAAQREPSYERMIARATALFGDLEYPQGAATSAVLPVGYDERLRAVAAAVQAFLQDPAAGNHSVESAFAELLRHERAARDMATPMARMAVRLTRWLALPDSTAPTNLEQATLRQARDDAFVDWAAADVWVGSTDPHVSSAWAALFKAVRERRDLHDRQFAALLADATSRDLLPDTLIPVESFITHTVKPLAAGSSKALLIVVDGMSTGVAAELTEEILQSHWFELVPDHSGARGAVLAALPTLTRFSRTSLFCGELKAGSQQEERSGFAALTGGRVFHKADLVGDAGEALPAPLLQAIRSQDPLHAVVLNTVDDTLSKADPGGLEWTVSQIRHLPALLDEAARAGRTVILTSDHGHVVERGGDPKPISGAEARWRPADTGAVDAEREVALSGRRVLSEGGSIVAAVDEALRYSTKQAGYHGGASAAEAVIPVIVLSKTPDQVADAGWTEAAPQIPIWWNDEVVATPAAQPARKPKPRKEPTAPVLFEIDEETSGASAPTDHSVIDQVLASAIYQSQKARYGARAASDAMVRDALTVLLRQAGRAHRNTVASAAGIPAMRIAGAMTALRRQLNVEGYEVLSIDVDDVTVILDETLLRQQFLEGLET